MRKLLDKGLLLAACTAGLYFFDVTTAHVLAWLGAIGLSALCSYFSGRTAVLLNAAACLLAVGIPELRLFLPLFVYECGGAAAWPFRLLWALPLTASLFTFGPAAVWTIALSLLAFLLACRTGAFEQMRGQYFEMQDATKEKARRLEQKNRDLMEKQDYEVRLATLTERNRIAREIHDNVGHLLTRSILQAGALRVICGDRDDLREPLGLLSETLDDAMDNIRRSVHDLHEEAVDLRIQLCALIEGFRFCPVQLHYDAEAIPKALQLSFVAIVKEALSNIARHSGATEARISVLEHPAFYQLVIADNGHGGGRPDSGGFGLSNMRERVEAFHGIFRLSRDEGFQIFISVPKEDPGLCE